MESVLYEKYGEAVAEDELEDLTADADDNIPFELDPQEILSEPLGEDVIDIIKYAIKN